MSGNPSFYDIRNEFYKDTNGVILTFDVTNRKTFENLIRWVRELHFESGEANSVTSPVIIVCGNKVDKAHRSVTYYEVSEWAAVHQYPYFETSALTGHGVTEAFNTLFESIINPDVYQSCISNQMKLNNYPKQSNIPSSLSSNSSLKSNKNEQFKVTYQNLLEINRIKNAKNNYERLGISITASSEEIQKAFRRLAFILHPDKNNTPGSEEAFKILVKAKDSLLSLSNGSGWFTSKF
ncbi:unnamed protein product [Schistosoma rodhaini]|nr:unnamed protein product [Schistosoma rodhaini]CAH8648929.1 unnamed protein product [Schistosoma rodhaini]